MHGHHAAEVIISYLFIKIKCPLTLSNNQCNLPVVKVVSVCLLWNWDYC